MRIAEIEALKLEDKIVETLLRHYGETRSYALKAAEVNPELSENEIFYNRILFDLDEGEAQPTYEELLVAFSYVKEQLRIERVEELIASVDSSYFQKWGFGKGLVYNQIDNFIESKAREDDEAFFTTLSNEIAVFKKEDSDKLLVEHGKIVKTICENTLAFITGLNSQKELTSEQIDTLQTSYASVEEALRKQRPQKALGLFATVTPIAGIVTQEEIDSVVAFLTGELQAVIGG